MARGHPGIPSRVAPVILRKAHIFDLLRVVDADLAARDRTMAMEIEFRKRIDAHIGALPQGNAAFQKFNTSPFVLMFYSRQQGYQHVAQIEKDIVPAKVFSSMETSAGRMIETVALPAYGWSVVPSSMHSSESVLDGRKKTTDGSLMVATLKSGPRCLNDEMAKDIGIDVVTHAPDWMTTHAARRTDFTYGVLYGTKKQSNKKDWHILRNIRTALPAGSRVLTDCDGGWAMSYDSNLGPVTATVRVGLEWWNHLGGPTAWLELCIALIRACIAPQSLAAPRATYRISDLAQILDLGGLPDGYNVSLLQRSQLEWLLFLSRHFCDELRP